MQLKKESHEAMAQLIASNPCITPQEVTKQLDRSSLIYVRELMVRSDIKGRVLEIQREASKLNILSLEERLKLLSDMASNKKETTANRIKAIESLTKLTNNNGLVETDGLPDEVIQPVIVQIPDNKR